MKEKVISARMYRQKLWADPNYRYIQNKFKRWFYNFLSRRKHILFKFISNLEHNAKVLDWGCGHGFLTLPLKREYNFNVYGCDIVADSLKSLKKYSSESGIHLKLMKVEPDKLQYPSEFFDAVVSADVFEHVSKPDLCLKEIYRVLKPGGIVAFHTDSSHYRDRSIYKNIINHLNTNPWGLDIGHINLINFDKLKQLIEKTGFKIIKIKSAPQYFGFFLGKDITWCFNQPYLDNIWWFRPLKIWHRQIYCPKHKLINLFFNFCLALEETIEMKLLNKPGGSIYFKLQK